jgi:hypothetical protein
MQFQVPQFVEVEDKILGPLTALQFAYVAGGGGFLFAMWLILPLWLAILIGGPVALLGAGLAFYIWAKKTPKIAASEDILLPGETQREDPAKYVPSATANKIKDLAWSLDIKESVYSDKEQQ